MLDIDFEGSTFGSDPVGCWTGLRLGVLSTSACLPLVQGGISRNSSNVRTRRLQHFQPITVISDGLEDYR